MVRLTVAFALLAGMAAAQDAACPAPPDREDERRALMRELRTAPDPSGAQRASRALWDIWADAPDERAQALLDRGRAMIALGDLGRATEALDELVAYCPDYAEGWNQRGFASFLRRDFEAALTDLDRAMALSPEHLGVLSGRALTLLGLGRDEEGQAQLRAALRLNPWLAEAALLDGPPEREL